MNRNVYLLYEGWEGSAEMDAHNRKIEARHIGNHDGFVVLEASMNAYDRILRWWLEGTSLRTTVPATTKIKRRGNTAKKVTGKE